MTTTLTPAQAAYNADVAATAADILERDADRIANYPAIVPVDDLDFTDYDNAVTPEDAHYFARQRVTAADKALAEYAAAIRDGLALSRALAPANEAATGRPVTRDQRRAFVESYAYDARLAARRAAARVVRADA